MIVNGVTFTPQEAEAITIALDRMKELEEEAASIARIENDWDYAKICYNEAAVCESANQKWTDIRRAERTI